jgi:acetyl-CoA synthetase
MDGDNPGTEREQGAMHRRSRTGDDTMTVQAFLDARDFLLRHRTDYETAYRDFEWPVLDAFNWALDYFDPMARGNDAPALWIVDAATGTGDPYSFAQMSSARRGSRTGCAASASCAATGFC